MDDAPARSVIVALGMQRHPEGGWFVETWRAAEPPHGGRPAASAILFLLEASDRSHWHRLDVDEVWEWSGGGPVELRIHPTDDSAPTIVRLGPVDQATVAQAVVPAGAWQSAAPLADWALVGCVCAPAFDYAGFELAPPGWAPDGVDWDQAGNGSSRMPHGEP